MYSELEIQEIYNTLPIAEGDDGYRTGEVDEWGDYYDDEHSSQGTFTYIPLGGGLSDETSDDWDGGCFACWGQIDRTHLMTSISYQSPVPNLPLGKRVGDFLATGWDTVIAPPFGDNLPSFAQLRTMDYLKFDDTRNRSLAEASFYFRLARSYVECLSFPVTASLLRHRYPDTSAEVLFAMACFSPLDLAGMTGCHYPVDPNQTMPGEWDLNGCLSMMRNWLWAKEQGGWRIDRINLSTDAANPLSRTYYGHDYYWFGAGEYFKTKVDWSSEYLKTYNQESRAVAKLRGWEAVDAFHDIFVEAEAEAKQLAISEVLNVHVNCMRIPGMTKACKAVDKSRYW